MISYRWLSVDLMSKHTLEGRNMYFQVCLGQVSLTQYSWEWWWAKHLPRRRKPGYSGAALLLQMFTCHPMAFLSKCLDPPCSESAKRFLCSDLCSDPRVAPAYGFWPFYLPRYGLKTLLTSLFTPVKVSKVINMTNFVSLRIAIVK